MTKFGNICFLTHRLFRRQQHGAASCFLCAILAKTVTKRWPTRGREAQGSPGHKNAGAYQGCLSHAGSENSYDELTVSALCAQAQIGRKTFYVYYSSLDSLFEEILEEITRDYLDSIAEYSAPSHIREITRKFYEFSTSQGKYYDNLVCSDSYQRIGTRLMMRLVRGTWCTSSWFTSLSRERQDILLCFIYNSGAGLYRQWILSGKTIPVDTMIDYADRLIAKGIEGFRNLD